MKILYNKFLPLKGFASMNLFGVILAREEYKPPSKVTLNHEIFSEECHQNQGMY